MCLPSNLEEVTDYVIFPGLPMSPETWRAGRAKFDLKMVAEVEYIWIVVLFFLLLLLVSREVTPITKSLQ